MIGKLVDKIFLGHTREEGIDIFGIKVQDAGLVGKEFGDGRVVEDLVVALFPLQVGAEAFLPERFGDLEAAGGDGLEHVVFGDIEITHHQQVAVFSILTFLFEVNPFRQAFEFLEPGVAAAPPSGCG